MGINMRHHYSPLIWTLTLMGGVGCLPGQGFTWTQISTAGPAARQLTSMVSDKARQKVVLFGGWNSATPVSHFADTWEWDGVAWIQAQPATSPPGRRWHSMAYDELRQRVVLFGGSINSTELDDTWEWDGSNWVDVSPVASPPRRDKHAMVYDTARQRVVLFGGYSPGLGFVNDTWEWDGVTWSQAAPAFSPPGRAEHGMAYDRLRDSVVMFGGNGNNGMLADTWEWDGVTWFPRFATNYPTARSGHAVAYDEHRQRTVLFGGWTGVGGAVQSDTWEWDGSDWSLLQANSSPAARRGFTLAYDENLHRVALFGGNGATTFGDTWINGPAPVLASATSYGTGCGVPPLNLEPDATGRPVIGMIGTATISNAPTSLGAVALGWSDQMFGPFALPVPLNSIGMSSCILWQSSDVLGLTVASSTAGTLSFALQIPSLIGLLGSSAYLQAYVFSPGANALQLVSSNGMTWTFGDV